MLYVLCAILYALCSMLYALCSMLYALSSMLYALCFKLYALNFALCSVLCALCPHTPTHAHTCPSPLYDFFVDNFLPRLFRRKIFTTFYGFVDNFLRRLFRRLFTALLKIFYGFFVLLSMQYKFRLRSTKV